MGRGGAGRGERDEAGCGRGEESGVGRERGAGLEGRGAAGWAGRSGVGEAGGVSQLARGPNRWEADRFIPRQFWVAALGLGFAQFGPGASWEGWPEEAGG